MSTPTLDEALQLKRAGSLDAAVIALEGLLSQSPDHPLALAHLADVQLRRGRPDEAATALDRAEAIAGTTRFTAHLRGDAHYKAERWAEAASAYQDADTLGEQGTWSLLQLARCRLHLGDLDGARGAAGKALERNEAAAPAWALLGDIAKRQDRLDEAESMFERAHQHAPDDQWAYAKLVEVRLLRLPEDKRSREIEVLVKSSGAGNPHLLGVLAKLRSQHGENLQAAETWRRARLQGGNLYTRKMEGYELRKAGRLDEAAAALGECLAADPQDLVLYKTFVHLQRQRGALAELRLTLEELAPRAGRLKGSMYGELRKLQTI
ncbi:MAG: tetratricopeptide repeat protein [Actinomycetota bacterium]|nr:tetratricopeptide repeat protein [Actinomycetota bacterium]